MKQAKVYSIKVWLTTALFAPLLNYLLRFHYLQANDYDISDHQKIYDKLLQGLPKMIAGALIFTLPLGFGIYYLIILLNRKSIQFDHFKRYLFLPGVILAVLPELLFLGYLLITNLPDVYRISFLTVYGHVMACYAIAASGGIWFYQIGPITGAGPDDTDISTSANEEGEI